METSGQLMSFASCLAWVIKTFSHNLKKLEILLMHGLIRIMNRDQNQEGAAIAAGWVMLSAAERIRLRGRFRRLRNNGRWVYLSPQINGVCDSANYLSNCGRSQGTEHHRRRFCSGDNCSVCLWPALHVGSEKTRLIKLLWGVYFHCLTISEGVCEGV